MSVPNIFRCVVTTLYSFYNTLPTSRITITVYLLLRIKYVRLLLLSSRQYTGRQTQHSCIYKIIHTYILYILYSCRIKIEKLVTNLLHISTKQLCWKLRQRAAAFCGCIFTHWQVSLCNLYYGYCSSSMLMLLVVLCSCCWWCRCRCFVFLCNILCIVQSSEVLDFNVPFSFQTAQIQIYGLCIWMGWLARFLHCIIFFFFGRRFHLVWLTEGRFHSLLPFLCLLASIFFKIKHPKKFDHLICLLPLFITDFAHCHPQMFCKSTYCLSVNSPFFQFFFS